MVAFCLQNNPFFTHSVNFYSTLWMLKNRQPALWRGSAWHINLSWLKFIFNESSFLAQLLASPGKGSEKPKTWKHYISIEFLVSHTSACWSCILAHKVPRKGTVMSKTWAVQTAFNEMIKISDHNWGRWRSVSVLL